MRLLRNLYLVALHAALWFTLLVVLYVAYDTLAFREALIEVTANQTQWLRAIANGIHGTAL